MKDKAACCFDIEERFPRLSGLGGQLEAFSRIRDFEVFRPDLAKLSTVLLRQEQTRVSSV